MTNKTLYNFLLNLDLSHYEAIVYEGLLKIKEGTVKEIAEFLSINRITTHDTIQLLIEKDLLTESQTGPRRRKISITSPKKLEYLIQQKENNIKSIKESLPKMIEEMNSFRSKTLNKPFSIRFYEGKIAVMHVYKETLKENSVYSFADLEKYYQVFPDTMDIWIDAFNKNPQREMWDLLVDSPTSRNIALQKYERYYTKILPDPNLFKGIQFADYMIYANKVAIIKLDIENPVATVIESEEVAASLRALHQTMWEIIPG